MKKTLSDATQPDKLLQQDTATNITEARPNQFSHVNAKQISLNLSIQ